MRNYCTLFDRNYLVKGLALHASFVQHCSEDSKLYVLAMDIETVQVLTKLQRHRGLSNLEIIDLRDFSNPYIETAKSDRTWQEFCWTMASVLCDRLLNDNGMSNITYLDADTFLFSDPKKVHEELVGGSIGITPHRLIPARKELEVNGLYNVGWVTFKHNNTGQDCCSKWARACLGWCYNRHEPGKFGDQKYLDRWPIDYRCCCKIIQNLGCNAAPWNISQYKVEKKEDGIYIENDKLVLYHFHEFRKLENGTFYYTGWPLQSEVIENIYLPYVALTMKIEKELEEAKPWLSY